MGTLLIRLIFLAGLGLTLAAAGCPQGDPRLFEAWQMGVDDVTQGRILRQNHRVREAELKGDTDFVNAYWDGRNYAYQRLHGEGEGGAGIGGAD